MTTTTPNLLFGRTAIVTIGTLQIKYLDVSFTVKKTLKPSPNTAEVRIWNLSEDHRNQLEAAGAATVQIEAGYGTNTSVLFLGDLQTAKPSENDGKGNILTTIGGSDGAKKHQTARVHVTHAKGSTTRAVLQSLVDALGVLPGNSAKAISAIQSAGLGDRFTLGTVLSGSAEREMTHILRSVGYTWSIQNGALQLLALKQALAGTALSLESTPGNTGLIGSPSIDKDGVLQCKSLIVPDAFPGRLLVIKSQRISGQFRIEETNHTGDTKGGSWYVEYKAKRY